LSQVLSGWPLGSVLQLLSGTEEALNGVRSATWGCSLDIVHYLQ